MSITPDFVGQVYKDTATGNIWRANSTTPGDWTLELQNMQIGWNPTTLKLGQTCAPWIESAVVTSIEYLGTSNLLGINIPACANLLTVISNSIQSLGGGSYAGFYVADNPKLTDISFPACASVQDDVTISGNTLLDSIDLSGLVTASEIAIFDNPALASVSLDSIVSVDSDFEINGATGITNLTLPDLVTVPGDISILDCTTLQTLSIPNWLPENGTVLSFNGNALNLASVDGILARGVANAAFVSGSIFIQGGTNAAPTLGAGSAHDILVARGVSITHN